MGDSYQQFMYRKGLSKLENKRSSISIPPPLNYHLLLGLYSAWCAAGLFDKEKLLTLRKIDSDLEGHPTPR